MVRVFSLAFIPSSETGAMEILQIAVTALEKFDRILRANLNHET
jgi:hypothetical protein